VFIEQSLETKSSTVAAFTPDLPDVDDFSYSAIADLFDVEYYLLGFPSGTEPKDPIEHYIRFGHDEGRNPAPWFSGHHYLAMNPDVAAEQINPFLHYCVAGKNESRVLPSDMRRAREADGVFDAHAFAVSAGPHFEEFDPTIGIGRRKRAKVLAYYLPQFHPVEVNDRQWGAGFTEWRQLPRAMPRFEGHIQPRIPRDLGCYSLTESDTMRRQIEMAQAAGLFGFCFYHYWFDGKRVLEAPMERFLADPTLDFPFCLMWANENWTRTWDGSEKEIILAQTYREEEEVHFIDDLARHMADSRYIRLNGRPLFFIYRPGHIPDARETVARWRELFRLRHGLDPLFFHAQAFGDNDPRDFDLDGAIEFPPHKVLNYAPDAKHLMSMLDSGFTGSIPTYESVVSSAKRDADVDFPLIRTVFPSWDNDARRPGRGTIVAHSTPEAFADWFDWAVRQAEANPVYGESIVCVNAWNEWAEGAYLEPDVHFGAAYINALSRVLHNTQRLGDSRQKRVLLVGHDAMNFGAQSLLGNIARVIVRQFGGEVRFLLISEGWKEGVKGGLLAGYKDFGRVHIVPPDSPDLPNVLSRLRADGFVDAITNSVATGSYVRPLKAARFNVVSLVHELPNLLRTYGLDTQAASISALSDHVIFPAQFVQDAFETFAGPVDQKAEVFPQGLYKTEVIDQVRGDHGLRAELGLDPGTRIVLGVGYADLRKGIDRFVSTGLSLAAAHRNLAFVWVGAPSGEASNWFQPEIDGTGLSDRVRILGHRDDVARFFAAADAFYLSSREDPFPSVVLEALAAGLPVVGHRGCGGCDELIERHGTLVAQNDPMAAASALLKAVRKANPRAAEARRDEIVGNYDFGSYVFGLIQRLKPDTSPVSAIIPNYNYAAYIGERLRSVFDQTYPLREVIVLDDASTDDSLAEIERTAQAAGRDIDLLVNATKSGSPFPQWRRGAERAKGDYVWIAEADDIADPALVARLTDRMQRAGSVLGFVDSRQIDETGAPLGDSYRPYMNQIEPGAFDQPFDMAGPEFLARFLAVKNVILNVSGVIVHRQTLLDAFDAVGDDLATFRVAGDWRLYAEICARTGSVVTWLPEPLNAHRRHSVSVTHALNVDKHLAEIAGMHRLVGERVGLTSKIRQKQRANLSAAEKHLRKVG
jgi:glycosyltransferase involved in cell wall biosynthesis